MRNRTAAIVTWLFLAVEAKAGLETFGAATEGAARFAAGEGRGGEGAGV